MDSKTNQTELTFSDLNEQYYIDHSSLVLQNLESLYLNKEFSDVTLIVEDEKIFAHRVILATSSEYFRALLYGGLQESQSNEITLKCKDVYIFRKLLEYVYKGKINLLDLTFDQLLIIFRMSHEYIFKALNETVSKHLVSILSLENVCIFYDLSNLYEIDDLRTACTRFLDNNAEQVLKQESFLRMSKTNLIKILSHDSFCANELHILIALNEWIRANTDDSAKELYTYIRTNLIDLEKLIELIRPFLNADQIVDLIYTTVKNKTKDYRCFTWPEINVASDVYETKILYGKLEDDTCENSHDTSCCKNNDSRQISNDVQKTDNDSDEKRANENQLDRDSDEDVAQNNTQRHDTQQNEIIELMSNLRKPYEESCLLLHFKYPFKINLIKMLLYQKDNCTYSYYIETSLDAKNWTRVIDHTHYICRSSQLLYFEPQVVRYVKVVATSCNISDHLKVYSIECLYTQESYILSQGLIKPQKNVATIERSAQVIEGVSRIKDVLLFGDSFKCDPNVSVTCHQINYGSITIQLSQPYMLSTIRFLLDDSDKRKYGYEVSVSSNNKKWFMLVSDTERKCKSWQTILFDCMPVVFIKIVGTYCSVNRAFNLLRFECF